MISYHWGKLGYSNNNKNPAIGELNCSVILENGMNNAKNWMLILR
jgi:hypothetical protein